MAFELELDHDASGRNTLAGIHGVFAAGGDIHSLEGFEFAPEVFKPLPDAAKVLYFLEVAGPESITEENTLDYVAKAAAGSGRYSFLSLLNNHVFESPSLTPLLAWPGPAANYGLLAAGKAKPRGGVLRSFDLPQVLGPEWRFVSGCWAETATLQTAVSAAGMDADGKNFAMSVVQLGLLPTAWPAP